MATVRAATSELPGGIVTFVFTDIEGSTRLLRRLGNQYAQALERHYALLRRAVGDHGGHDMGTAGDSLFVAFPDATAAVAACAQAQRSLGAARWPDDEPVRVRMGVHTGLAAPRNG